MALRLLCVTAERFSAGFRSLIGGKKNQKELPATATSPAVCVCLDRLRRMLQGFADRVPRTKSGFRADPDFY